MASFGPRNRQPVGFEGIVDQANFGPGGIPNYEVREVHGPGYTMNGVMADMLGFTGKNKNTQGSQGGGGGSTIDQQLEALLDGVKPLQDAGFVNDIRLSQYQPIEEQGGSFWNALGSGLQSGWSFLGNALQTPYYLGRNLTEPFSYIPTVGNLVSRGSRIPREGEGFWDYGRWPLTGWGDDKMRDRRGRVGR